jgi:hypothetical protein
MVGGENPDQSQFPFEAGAAPTQDPSRATQMAGMFVDVDPLPLLVSRIPPPSPPSAHSPTIHLKIRRLAITALAASLT